MLAKNVKNSFSSNAYRNNVNELICTLNQDKMSYRLNILSTKDEKTVENVF